MSTLTRKRGDNYPIGFNYKVNGEAVSLDNTEVKFSFILVVDGVRTGDTTTITGTADTEVVGRAIFSPTVEQMSVAGQYEYDFQRVIDTVVYTHADGTMLLTNDVTK